MQLAAHKPSELRRCLVHDGDDDARQHWRTAHGHRKIRVAIEYPALSDVAPHEAEWPVANRSGSERIGFELRAFNSGETPRRRDWKLAEHWWQLGLRVHETHDDRRVVRCAD